MKQTFKIMAVYIGLVIGAGFASGREVLEYFNLRSNTNIGGVLIASFLFMVIAYIILSKASKHNLTSYSAYVSSIAGKAAPFAYSFMLVYMFCGLFVMLAGSGALVDAISPLNSLWGAVLMSLICFIVLSFDLKGIVALNLILVPLMICGIIYVSVCSAIFGDIPAFAQSIKTGGTVAMSAICYASYNTATAGAVLVPLANGINKKTIRTASVGGGFVIGLLIMFMWTVIGLNFEIVRDSELPMLTLAAICGKSAKQVYTTVLFMAICTTAVSYGFGLMSHFADKIKSARERVLFAAVLCLSAIPFSLYGFSNLVAQLYSLFGYIGMIWIIMILFDRLR